MDKPGRGEREGAAECQAGRPRGVDEQERIPGIWTHCRPRTSWPWGHRHWPCSQKEPPLHCFLSPVCISESISLVPKDASKPQSWPGPTRAGAECWLRGLLGGRWGSFAALGRRQRPLATSILGEGQMHQPSLQTLPPLHCWSAAQDPPGGETMAPPPSITHFCRLSLRWTKVMLLDLDQTIHMQLAMQKDLSLESELAGPCLRRHAGLALGHWQMPRKQVVAGWAQCGL